ncbi:hypothetical protein [Marmoricola sp. RAF53]|uniref:hypothetical protein n=1 Tax=Marmoricola sp. RAF53 TaxID=3233059 RepID=UPI003F997113
MERVERAGRRLRSAEDERHAALDELADACAELPEETSERLAREAEVPVEGIIALRLRLLERARARRTGPHQ